VIWPDNMRANCKPKILKSKKMPRRCSRNKSNTWRTKLPHWTNKSKPKAKSGWLPKMRLSIALQPPLRRKKKKRLRTMLIKSIAWKRNTKKEWVNFNCFTWRRKNKEGSSKRIWNKRSKTTQRASLLSKESIIKSQMKTKHSSKILTLLSRRSKSWMIAKQL